MARESLRSAEEREYRSPDMHATTACLFTRHDTPAYLTADSVARSASSLKIKRTKRCPTRWLSRMLFDPASQVVGLARAISISMGLHSERSVGIAKVLLPGYEGTLGCFLLSA